MQNVIVQRNAKSRTIAAAGVLLLMLGSAWACGPWFPNSMLMGGDATLLLAPITDFQAELNRIKAPPPAFQAVLSSNGLPAQTFEAEWADLQAALEKTALAESEQNRLLSEFQNIRLTLQRHAEAVENWQRQQLFRVGNEPPDPAPTFQGAQLPAGLPQEFAHYLAGSVAYHSGDSNAARLAWETLLSLPGGKRHFRSVWAAFMLGKTWLGAQPAKATEYFEKTRELAKAGFADSIGLGASSYGWQAKAELQRGKVADAVRLYFIQYQTGDPTAAVSLRFVSRRILSEPAEQLESLAQEPLVQQIVTAYIVSRRGLSDVQSAEETTALIRSWLEGVTQAGVDQVACADRLALAAYQRGLFDLTSQWLAHAPPNSGMAQWLRAKLLLRKGKTTEAAKLLSQVIRLLPREGGWSNPPILGSAHFEQANAWDDDSPVRQAMGELGVLQLARRDYYEALDTLLRSGHWSDAAYVAEYVLSPDELSAYVDRQWPANEPHPEPTAQSVASFEGWGGWFPPREIATELRHLTSRRLARLGRFDEAAEFATEKWKPKLIDFNHHLQAGLDQAQPASSRAASLWKAAQIARADGLELFGTEVEPDWQMTGGQYSLTSVGDIRSREAGPDGNVTITNISSWFAYNVTVPMSIAPGTSDEQRRIKEHKPNPDLRFHYRYYAANLAWQAAVLMPNNNDETAKVLWAAGTWLKARDPEAADRFYKSLVRRCRKTALGQEADRLRWFPKSADPPPSDQ